MGCRSNFRRSLCMGDRQRFRIPGSSRGNRRHFICWRNYLLLLFRNFNRLNLPPWPTLSPEEPPPLSRPTRPSQLVSRVVMIQITTASTRNTIITCKDKQNYIFCCEVKLCFWVGLFTKNMEIIWLVWANCIQRHLKSRRIAVFIDFLEKNGIQVKSQLY
jgi:hypothetical protein